MLNPEYVRHHKEGLVGLAISMPIFLFCLMMWWITYVPGPQDNIWFLLTFIMVFPAVGYVLELNHGCGNFGECVNDVPMFKKKD